MGRDRRRGSLGRVAVLGVLVVGATLHSPAWAGDRPLTFGDLMAFRQIEDPSLSEDGSWLAYTLRPDRGDAETRVRSVEGDQEWSILRGTEPLLTPAGAWAAARVVAPFADREKAQLDGEDPPEPGLVLLSTADGSTTVFERVVAFAFSSDGAWLARHHAVAEAEPAAEDGPAAAEEAVGGTSAEPGADTETSQETDAETGTELVLRRLDDASEVSVPDAVRWAFSESGRWLAVVRAGEDGRTSLEIRDLSATAAPASEVATGGGYRFTNLAWAEEVDRLGFVAAGEGREGEAGPGELRVWEPGQREALGVVGATDAPFGWWLPSTNELAWSRDGERLFFGLRPGPAPEPDDSAEAESAEAESAEQEPAGDETGYDPWDLEALRELAEVDLWHGDDPLISTNQHREWEETEKDRVYRAVWHRGGGRVVRLAGPEVRDVQPVHGARAALGRADTPWLRERTWAGFMEDAWWIDLETGRRQWVAERLREEPSLSPGGRYVAWYRAPHWYLFDSETGESRNLTRSLEVPFADEDHDYPSPAPGYGVAGWLEGDAAVLIYDKYDLWRFPTNGGEPRSVTGGRGREAERIFRLVDLDPDVEALAVGEPLLLTGYHDRVKTQGFWGVQPDGTGFAQLLDEPLRWSYVGRAEEADRLLFTRESYDVFPDLWVAGRDLAERRRLTDTNPQIADYAWGEAELVEWTSRRGEELQGVLIRPGNYEPGRRYPVLVYFYRFMSQRLHQFNEPVVNHRPSFPLYASNGYAVFLPDIRFEIGHPGRSAVDALVPGVEKLVEMGVADPEAIGLHGHSWSGYQAAYVVTRADVFAAAVAGAPVANMTSAYSGIRWGTGLARQFQYEIGQSRIGGSLWDSLDLYIENSPVFFADRITTPLLIQFGDEDEAVPWWQGIELYLAMRRLDKPVWFLQYRGEPHHLKKAPNQLDYSLRMKEFFDHFLLGAPAPAWLAGEPYLGG